MQAKDVEIGKKYRFTLEGEVIKADQRQINIAAKGLSITSWLLHENITAVEELPPFLEEPPVGSKVKRVFSDGSGSLWEHKTKGWFCYATIYGGVEESFSISRDLWKWDEVTCSRTSGRPSSSVKLYLLEEEVKITKKETLLNG